MVFHGLGQMDTRTNNGGGNSDFSSLCLLLLLRLYVESIEYFPCVLIQEFLFCFGKLINFHSCLFDKCLGMRNKDYITMNHKYFVFSHTFFL